MIFKSENEMMDRYNAVENYRSVVSNAFTSIEDSVNSLYVKSIFQTMIICFPSLIKAENMCLLPAFPARMEK